MSKYQPGIYHVVSFDRLGARSGMQLADTYSEAKQKRAHAISAGAASGVILRVISNSLIQSRPWDSKPGDDDV